MINCIRTIHLLTSAYPAVLSGTNASTLLPYLKNANSVSLHLHEFSPVANHRSLGRGTSDFRLPAQDIPGVDTSYAKDCCKVWSRASGCPTTNDYQAFWFGWCAGLFGLLLFSLEPALIEPFLRSSKKPLDVCALLCSI